MLRETVATEAIAELRAQLTSRFGYQRNLAPLAAAERQLAGDWASTGFRPFGEAPDAFAR
jgi:hypothetical protein